MKRIFKIIDFLSADRLSGRNTVLYKLSKDVIRY